MVYLCFECAIFRFLKKNKELTIRGVQEMFDSNLTKLYGIKVKALNQAVKRNKEYLPENSMLQLTESEIEQKKLTSKQGICFNGQVFDAPIFIATK